MLRTQNFPNAPNVKSFPSSILKAIDITILRQVITLH